MASKERMKNYKNKAKDQEELRRKREEEGIQLRKQKRDEQVRNVSLETGSYQFCVKPYILIQIFLLCLYKCLFYTMSLLY